MRRESLEGLAVLEIPDGFELRTFRVGDEVQWANLMTGAIGVWDEESTARLFLGDPGVRDHGIFLLATGDECIATATDKLLPELDVGYLHMVAVAPPCRGRGLGRCISLAALLHMRGRGCQQAVLDTDDFRLPAIRTYLGLGFVPEMVGADHAERWRTIFAEINAARPNPG
jgi:mycothiol synthase